MIELRQWLRVRDTDAFVDEIPDAYKPIDVVLFWTQASLAAILIGDTIIDLIGGSIILAILNLAVMVCVAITARIAYRRYKEIP